MTSFEDIWNRELEARLSPLKIDPDVEEFIKLLCNLFFVEGSSDGYHRGREDALKSYDKITNKLFPVGKGEDYGD